MAGGFEGRGRSSATRGVEQAIVALKKGAHILNGYSVVTLALLQPCLLSVSRRSGRRRFRLAPSRAATTSDYCAPALPLSDDG